MSKENVLGRNIQHLRKMHGETLQELGDAVFLGNTTIKNYESGGRDPNPQILAALAKHYGKTVDELLNTDLTELGKLEFAIEGSNAMVELWKVIIPLSSSEKALENANFKKGYEKCCSILDRFSRNETVLGHIISDCFELFSKSIEEDDLPEAAANMIWLIFLNWSQVMDQSMIDAFMSIIYPRKNQPSANKLIMKAKSEVSEDTIRKRKEYLDDLDDLDMEILKELKAVEGWSDFANYIVCLKYLLGMVDSGLSSEMNEAVGMQMLLSQVQLGNIYAIKTLKTVSSL